MSCTTAGRCGVDHEYKLAACDVKRTSDEYGFPVTVRFLGEAQVTRDRLGSIINRTSASVDLLQTHAYPIQFSPTAKQKTEGGIREDTDVIIWTPILDWDDANFDIDELNTLKGDVQIDNKTYEIVDKALRSQYGIRFLYVVLGLNKK